MLSFTMVCFTILIHPSQFHKCFSLFIIRTIRYIIFRCSKHCIVDWNGRRRLLENTNRFSSCDVMLPELSLSWVWDCALLVPPRSEEHTSELQSRFDLVCRLLLEKKKR